MNVIKTIPLEKIIPKTKSIIRKLQQLYDDIAKLDNEDCTFKNVIEKISMETSKYQRQISEITFPINVSPDAKIRIESLKATDLLDKFSNEIKYREDIYQKIIQVSNKKEKLNRIEKELLKGYVEDYKNIGMHLDSDKRAILEKYDEELSSLTTKYNSTMNEDKTHIFFISSLKRNWMDYRLIF
jgi:Zn-dependent oligopeptidase